MSASKQSFIRASIIMAVLALFATTTASAQDFRTDPRTEPWWGKVDVGVAFPLNDPYRDAFGIGVAGGGAIYRSAFPYLAFGARLAGGFLSEDGDEGNLRFGTLSGVTRFHPLANMDRDRRGTNLWLEAGIGGALIDGNARLLFEGAVGYTFGFERLGIGPFFRVNHIVERDADDLFIGIAGLEFVLGGRTDRDRTF